MKTDSRDAPNGSQWTEWKGGECPVAGNVRVEVKYLASGEPGFLASDYREQGLPASEYYWASHNMSPGTIVAYRVVGPLLETGAPPAAPAATPRTESGEWPTPEYAQRIMFEGCDSVVMAPEDYEALYELARTLERENADLRAQLAEVKEALAGDDYASLPSDYPLARMAHTIRADHDKFRNQVIDTCKRAETAERQRVEARADERERCAKVLEARAESVEGPTNAYAVGELYEAALAIRALKEASNG
jgi:hypothetical protein